MRMLICVSELVRSSKRWDLRSMVCVSFPLREDQVPLGPLEHNGGCTKMIPVPKVSQIPKHPLSTPEWMILFLKPLQFLNL